MNLSYFINKGWYWISSWEGERFQDATRQTRRTQKHVLDTIVQRNLSSEYGLRHHFSNIHSFDDYRAQVPIVRYEHLQDVIDRIIRGEKNLLTISPVVRFVPTGGSSGGAKLIPYTAHLKRDFQRAVAAWIWSTFRSCPRAMNGRAYWSITPMGKPAKAISSLIPIGFESDSEYLGGWSRWFAEQLLLPPSRVSRLDRIDDARYANLFYLLASADLALISVWSPTFLISLLNQLDEWIEPICKDLADGKLRFPSLSHSKNGGSWDAKPNPERAEKLRSWYGKFGCSAQFMQHCWLDLSLLSCWGDGNSSYYFSQLKKLFPAISFQPKGLLATESVVSFPFGKEGKSALAIRSHFFEFAPIAPGEDVDYHNVKLADELSCGSRYRVIVTTNGGLYRYDLGDVIEVIGFEAECPQIRFVGRMDAVSDLVGEKLNESHVRSTLEKLFLDFAAEQELYVVVPYEQPILRYALILSSDTNLSLEQCQNLATVLDERLRSNPQYDLARNLGQLAGLKVEVVSQTGRNLWTEFEAWQSGVGKRVGDMKASVLDYRGIWREFLKRYEPV